MEKGAERGMAAGVGLCPSQKAKLVSSELHMGRAGSIYSTRFLSEQMTVSGEKHVGLTKATFSRVQYIESLYPRHGDTIQLSQHLQDGDSRIKSSRPAMAT